MELTELTTYNRKNVEEVMNMGSDSFSCAKLLYDKHLKKYVVGKFFSSNGVHRSIRLHFAYSKKKIAILANLKHKNIVRVFGELWWDTHNFVIILEYAPCGGLDSLLQNQTIALSWKLRARFFTELANALDYLHNHDPKKSYVHGDLKPENVLLGNKLQIKLGDFGLTSIVKLTGAVFVSNDGQGKPQYATPFYAAPEFLKRPTKGKLPSMDVYSFGMIGYEIITRKTVFGEATMKTMIKLIIADGEKPNEQTLDKEATILSRKRNTTDLEIFHELKKIVKKSWQTEPDDRFTTSDIKIKLFELAQSKKIYDKATDMEAEAVAKEVKSQRQIKLRKLGKAFTTKCAPWTLFLTILVALIAAYWILEFNDLDSLTASVQDSVKNILLDKPSNWFKTKIH